SLTVARLSCILRHTGVSSSWVVWHVCLERYTRVLRKASFEFPIHFLKIYSATLLGCCIWCGRESLCCGDCALSAAGGGAAGEWHHQVAGGARLSYQRHGGG